MDSPGWTLTTPLPKAMDVVRGVTAEGLFYITGKLCGTDCNTVKF